ncbi:MAG TPA: hypothetical protein ENG67_03725, partial [candidate division WOR-3 bacterium]|nr:hypothetical protein [candidate division WOR-3 bacterium]
MRKVMFAVLALAFLSSLAGATRWISLGGPEGTPVEVKVLESSEQATLLSFDLKGYYVDEVVLNGNKYVRIALPGATPILEKGMPDLPKVARSIVIPDDASASFSIEEDRVLEVKTAPVIPSKGHLTRDIDPASVPYEFSDFYDGDSYYPEAVFSLGTPYILRDFRGMVVRFNPFQYNPSDNTLRIHRHLLVEVRYSKGGSVN